MNELLITLLAVVGIARATATTAAADEQGFVESVDSLDYYAIDCAGCAQRAVAVGYQACAAFARSGDTAAIQAVLRAYNGPGLENGSTAPPSSPPTRHISCAPSTREIGPI